MNIQELIDRLEEAKQVSGNIEVKLDTRMFNIQSASSIERIEKICVICPSDPSGKIEGLLISSRLL